MKHIYFQFHQIPLTGYLVMAPDRRTEHRRRKVESGGEGSIPTPNTLGGENIFIGQPLPSSNNPPIFSFDI